MKSDEIKDDLKSIIIAQLVKSNNMTKIDLGMINKYINLQYIYYIQ